ncbi:MAG: tRNA pseudouridine(38-40) synthase TruA [Defluviitaleaceae bacterium]|nr:tRNA pseudouridine(38-40) synthase TruA [Defluviitaleaceae bacterium]MCL2239738.1 tRNA pseudouridine(38-40) synthase TruA [Defluviitaleaceae bacterium]
MHILLTLAYDGTRYVGWQRQINGISVQQRLEEALAALLGHAVKTTASSRTDAGVHALGQRAAFHTQDMRIPLAKLPRVLNALLPTDISVSHAETVPDGFSPRFAAKYKTYIYHIHNAPVPNPLLRRYNAFIPHPLNRPAMEKAAPYFIGRHDFTSFCAAGGSAKTTVREIYACAVSADADSLALTVTGNGFLYNMVRIIAGTLVYAGLGKISPDSIPHILAAKNRSHAGKTLPPEGLVLAEVSYTALHPAVDFLHQHIHNEVARR